jgi:hypothetical protein
LLEYDNIPDITIDNNMELIIKNKINTLIKLFSLNVNKYNDEMKKLVKQINTLIYKKINTMTSPTLIKQYYDKEIVKMLTSDNTIKNHIEKFIDLTTYPSYFTDRILELVLAEYSEHLVHVSKLSYIELFDNIGNLKTEIVDLLLDGLMSNSKGSGTFVFDNYGPGFCQKIIKLLEKVKISDKFINFLRFFLINFYSSRVVPEDLIGKKILFRKYGEIPLYEFIGDYLIEKNLINTNKQNKMYCSGTTNNFYKENLLEMYYIIKCREVNDIDNFISHDKQITIDFSMLI